MAGETILIIDENPEAREFLVDTVLKPAGLVAAECDSFEAGLQLAEQSAPALVVLAMNTRGFSGPDLLDRLKPHGRSIPIILTTMQRADPWSAAAFRRGVYHILVKPFEPEDMQRAIERALDMERIRRERDDLGDKLSQLRRQMDRQLQELNAVYTIGKTVTAMLDLEQVLAQIVDAAVYMTKAEEGSLMLLDEPTGELYLRAAKNLDQRTARGLRIRVDDSVMGRVIKSGRPVVMRGHELTKINSSYLVKSLLNVPLHLPPDRVIGVLSVTNKVSDRNFTERDVFLMSAIADYAAVAIENARLFTAVEAERSKLEAVLRGTEETVLVLDQDRRVLLCNASARRNFNIETPAIANRPISDIIHNQALLDLFEHPPAPGRPARTEVQLADGRTLQAQVSAIDDIGYTVVMQDITHLKELDRIKSEFVSVVSHDLRSPLTTIRGYVELLGRVGPLNERQAEFVGRVERSMRTITDLIGDLLDIGRIEAGLDQEMYVCDLGEIVRQGATSLQMTAEEKRQSLSVDVAPDLPYLMGNSGRLEQVVTNLVSNAIKYTPEGGHIKVVLKPEGRYLMLRVSDNGIGISLEDQPYIFDKFFRVQSEQTMDIVGSGLGLSIVKSVVEKHGGRVWVESTPGHGSTFIALFPAHR